MILGPDKSKLSKRHGATAINEYQEQGYLPEAMVNFLALLGWSLDDKTEIMTVEAIVKSFSIERVSKTAAVFNVVKLEWMNGMYIRALGSDEFVVRCLPFIDRCLPQEIQRPVEVSYLRKIAPLIQERAKTLSEVPSLVDFFFTETVQYDGELLVGKLDSKQAMEILSKSRAMLEKAVAWDAQQLEDAIRPLSEELGLKAGPFFGVLRVAVTGRTASPPLFQTMEVLGRDICLARLAAALSKLQ
jgi:glutamyl-tRNA synthetase